jgi:flagellar basal-body rod protein FlgB
VFDLISSNGMIRTMDVAMTLASRRVGLIASNMANIDTPGYKTQDFSFQDAFQQEVARLDAGLDPSQTGATSLSPAREPVRAAYERNDGNDVNLDRESMLLARSQGTYQLASSIMQVEVRRIYQVIREGSK